MFGKGVVREVRGNMVSVSMMPFKGDPTKKPYLYFEEGRGDIANYKFDQAWLCWCADLLEDMTKDTLAVMHELMRRYDVRGVDKSCPAYLLAQIVLRAAQGEQDVSKLQKEFRVIADTINSNDPVDFMTTRLDALVKEKSSKKNL